MRSHYMIAVEYAERGEFGSFIEHSILQFQRETDIEGPWKHADLL